MIYNTLNGKISVLFKKWPSLLHLRVGGVLPVMEYRGSSAWKEVAISQVEEYHWLNLMFSILHDLVGSCEI